MLFNAAGDVNVDLVLNVDEEEAKDSQYEDVIACVLPLPEGVVLRSLTPADIHFLHHDTRRELLEVALVVSDARLGRSTGIPAGFFFAMGMRQLGLVTTSVDDHEVPDLSLDTILDLSSKQIQSALNAAVAERVVPSGLANQWPEIAGRLDQLRRDQRMGGDAAELFALRRARGASLDDVSEADPSLRRLVRARAIRRIADTLEAIPLDDAPALRTAIEGFNLHSLDEDDDIPAALLAAIQAVPTSQAAQRRFRQVLETSALPATLAAVMRPDQPLELNPLLADEVTRASVLSIADIAGVSPDRLLPRLLAEESVAGVTDGWLRGAVDDGDLQEDEARRVGLAANLCQLLDDDDDLTGAVLNTEFETLEQSRVASRRDLSRLTTDDLAPVIADSTNVTDPESIRATARRYTRRLQQLHPDVALFAASSRQPALNGLEDRLGRVREILRGTDGAVLGPPGQVEVPADLLDDVESLRALANVYRGMGVGDVLRDAGLAPSEMADRVVERVDLFQGFMTRNADRNLLALDVSPLSRDLELLDWEGASEDDKGQVLRVLADHQRAHAVSTSAEVAQAIMRSGMNSLLMLARSSPTKLAEETGLNSTTVAIVQDRADKRLSTTSERHLVMYDHVTSGARDLAMGGSDPGIEDLLHSFDSYREAVSSGSYCECDDCDSVLGAPAYVCQLLLTIEERIIDDYFRVDPRDRRRRDPLDPRVRRPDWWTTELTCRTTNTVIPTLVIVNEVLENLIADRDWDDWLGTLSAYSGDLKVGPDVDRSGVERFVYRDVLSALVVGYRQPYLRPLRELELLLSHFDLSRHEVAAVLRPPEPVRTRARLHLSQRDYELVTSPRSDATFLEQIYGTLLSGTGARIDPVDVLELLPPTGMSRAEFEALISTSFVSPRGATPIEIRAEKRDSESIQNDIERVYWLTTAALDRMHRFGRLWHSTRESWTIGELDRAVSALTHGGVGGNLDGELLNGLARLLNVQNEFGLTVQEALALWAPLLVGALDGRPGLFDSLFNDGETARTDPFPPSPARGFVHPDWADTPTGLADLQRLQAGLSLSDNDLLGLLRGLAEPLGIDPDSPDPSAREFELSLANLSLLYRHARLAALLGRRISELFHLASFADLDDPWVTSLDDLEKLLDTHRRASTLALTLDDLGVITDGVVLDPDSRTTPGDVATAVRDALDTDQALLFAPSALAFLDGMNEAASVATLQANAALAVPVGDGSRYRLADDYAVGMAWTLPPGVTADPSSIRALLEDHHSASVLPTYMSTHLGVPPWKIAALAEAAGIDLGSAGLVAALHGGDATPLADVISRLSHLALLWKSDVFTAEEISLAARRADLFEVTDVTAPTPAFVWAVQSLKALLEGTTELAEPEGRRLRDMLLAALEGFEPSSGYSGVDPALLADLLGLDAPAASALASATTSDDAALPALARLLLAAALQRSLGLGAVSVTTLISEDFDGLTQAVAAVRRVITTKYADRTARAKVLEPLDDALNVQRRDALLNALIATRQGFDSPAAVSAYTLLNCQISECGRTTRIVEMMNSIQTYLHRVRLNQEQDQRAPSDPNRTHVPPSSIPDTTFRVLKDFPTWRASQRVLLDPAYYMNLTVRDSATPAFKLFQEQISASLDEQSILDAYAGLVKNIHQQSQLQIRGALHDIGSNGDMLHLFAATPSDDPRYFYRTIENAKSSSPRAWVHGAWTEVDMTIPARYVAPAFIHGSLHLFWVEVQTRPYSTFEDGTSTFRGYRHSVAIKWSARRLDGTWTTPKALDLRPYNEHGAPDTFPILQDGLKGPDEYSMVPSLSPLGEPRHAEPRDAYTLEGDVYERLYVESADDGAVIVDAFSTMRGVLDLFTGNVQRDGRDQPLSRQPRPIQWLGGVLAGGGTKLWSSSPSLAQWNGLNDLFAFGHFGHRGGTAMATALGNYPAYSVEYNSGRLPILYLDAGRRWTSDVPVLLSPSSALAQVPDNTDVMPVFGRPQDVILRVGQDAFYSQVKPGADHDVRIRRLGTTLGEAISRAFFTGGLDGLLSLETQQSLAEGPSGLSAIGPSVDNQINDGQLDFEGSFGVELQEIWLWSTLEVARAASDQQWFEFADETLRRLFDPTADIEEGPPETRPQRERDRVWRYLGFRGQDNETLRDYLTDPDVLAASARDPFNPYAIGRVKPWTVKMAALLQWCRNRLDWSTSLLSHPSREKEALALNLVLSVQAVIGPTRPRIATCGLAETERTFAEMAPVLRDATGLLTEVETIEPRVNATGVKADYLVPSLDLELAIDGADRDTAAEGTVEVDHDGLVVVDALTAEGGPIYRPDWVSTEIAAWEENDGRGVVADPKRRLGQQHAGPTPQPGKRETRAPRGARESRSELSVGFARRTGPLFCFPETQSIADIRQEAERLQYLINNCMDPSGVRRQLPLFARDIDPALLARAESLGIPPDQVLALTPGDLPPHRFPATLARARSAAQLLSAFEQGELGEVERAEAEELTLDRLANEDEIANMVRAQMQQDVEAAEHSLEALRHRRASTEARRQHVQGLIDAGPSVSEVAETVATETARAGFLAAGSVKWVASILATIPQAGSPFALTFGGIQLKGAAAAVSLALADVAAGSQQVAAASGIRAGRERRTQGWGIEAIQLEEDTKGLDADLRVAELRLDIARRRLATHEAAIDHLKDLYTFHQQKLINLDNRRTRALAMRQLRRESTRDALVAIQQAEAALEFERPNVSMPTLDVATALGRENLFILGSQAIQHCNRLESLYLDTDKCEIQVDQPFSLREVDPAALVRLQETGETRFTVRQSVIEEHYPGITEARIKGVRLSIPCVTGPNENVSAVLTMHSGAIVHDPTLAAEPVVAPAPRCSVVAASTAHNDAGVFEFTFRGEKYLPFEGGGLVNSVWSLRIPKAFPQFDRQSINDVLLKVDFSAVLHEDLAAAQDDPTSTLPGSLPRKLREEGRPFLVDMGQSHSATMQRLKHASVGEPVPFDLLPAHFGPAGQQQLRVNRAVLCVRPSPDESVTGLELDLNGTTFASFAPDAEFGNLPSSEVTAAISGDPRGRHTISVVDPGALGSSGTGTGALDADKLSNIRLILECAVTLQGT